ncbi:MAG: hypothetical protein ACOH16_11790 [Propionibacteriaceae bacterium]
MIIDQVVAVLAAEGYGRDSIRSAMDALAEQDWRDEDDDWNEGDLRRLRRNLGTPVAASPDTHPAEAPVHSPAHGDDVPVDARDPRYDTDVWAADLARVFDRTTGGQVPLSPDQIRHVADYLLRKSSGLWDQSTHNPRVDDGSHDPDYSVERWADGIDEALQAVTNGRIEVTRVELQVAANLLLHAQEDDWVPQAALLLAEHEQRLAETP